MFHDWQFWTAAIQTAALIAAVIVARRVGLEQASISREQARISAQLLDFQYAFSVQVSYDQVRHIFYFWNTGYSNIYLEQEVFPEGHTHTEPQRQIIPAGHWWIHAAPWVAEYARMHQNLTLDIVVSNDRNERRMIRSVMNFQWVTPPAGGTPTLIAWSQTAAAQPVTG
jgi:hypothetical protein